MSALTPKSVNSHSHQCELVNRALEQELADLRSENRLLYESAQFYAELAERLCVRLRCQREES